LRLRLNEPASVTVIGRVRRSPGRRYERLGRVRFPSAGGLTAIALPRRLQPRIARGVYRYIVAAADGAGNRGQPRSIHVHRWVAAARQSPTRLHRRAVDSPVEWADALPAHRVERLFPFGLSRSRRHAHLNLESLTADLPSAASTATRPADVRGRRRTRPTAVGSTRCSAAHAARAVGRRVRDRWRAAHARARAPSCLHCAEALSLRRQRRLIADRLSGTGRHRLPHHRRPRLDVL